MIKREFFQPERILHVLNLPVISITLFFQACENFPSLKKFFRHLFKKYTYKFPSPKKDTIMIFSFNLFFIRRLLSDLSDFSSN